MSFITKTTSANWRSLFMVALMVAAFMILPANSFASVTSPTRQSAARAIVPRCAPANLQHPIQHPLTASFTTASTSTTALALTPPGLPDMEGSLQQSLLKLLLETMIVNGVPALFTILVIGFGAFVFRSRRTKEEDNDDYVMDRFGRVTKKNPAAELYSDLYEGDEDGNKKQTSLFSLFKKLKPEQTPAQINRGIPPLQYITITNLNQKYDSYQFSVTAATQSKAKAAAIYRAKNFDRALRLGLNSGGYNNSVTGSDLSPYAKTTLLELEKEFLEEGSLLLNKIQSTQTLLTKKAIDEEMEAMGVTPFALDPNATAPVDPLEETSKFYADDGNLDFDDVGNYVRKKREEGGVDDQMKKQDDGHTKKRKKSTEESEQALFTKLLKAQKELMKVELNFVKDVVNTLGGERATGMRTALLGDIAARGTGGLLMQLQQRPLSALLQGASSMSHHVMINGTLETEKVNGSRRKSLFVTRFPGDALASQVAELREEVTAIVRNAQPGDEALVILQTGGGTVTGYGLAAAQLLRFKEAGMKLTIAVEQVAASGGYMMCCVADKIVSSPFAVLGSIGVISDIPNVYERLEREGIKFQTVTAGKFKRTITPTKKVTKEDFEKTKQDVEQILVLFKQFVRQNRPNLDIEKVATGETWFGEDALERGLTDEIKTADELLTEYIDNGWDVYEVEYTPPDDEKLSLVKGFSGNSDQSRIGRAARWFIRTVVQEVKAELGNGSIIQQPNVPLEQQYLMVDDTADRIRVQK